MEHPEKIQKQAIPHTSEQMEPTESVRQYVDELRQWGHISFEQKFKPANDKPKYNDVLPF
jgi:hypothetical protein